MIYFSNTKKKKMIFIILIIGVIIMVSNFMFLGKPKFFTQGIDNLERVVVIVEPYHKGANKIVYITVRSEMEDLYYIIKNTNELNINKRPKHIDSIQCDSKFAVCFEYSNGEKDEFYATEREGGIYRLLSTKGNSGDPGYILGSNEKLWTFIGNATWYDVPFNYSSRQ